jgi:predicted O-methyltransferase YrrM
MEGTERLQLIDAICARAGAGIGGCSVAQGRALYELVIAERASTVLEIGLGHGISAMYIGCALLGATARHHVALDPNQTSGFDRRGLRNLASAGVLDAVRFIEEPSHAALPELEREGFACDFAFLDGGHLFDHTMLELFYCDRMLRPGGLLVFDDMHLKAVRRVVRYAISARGYSDISLPPAVSRHAAAGRQVKRAGRGLRAVPAAVRFAFAGERRELLEYDLGAPRRNNFGVIRKPLVASEPDWRLDIV